MEFHTEQKNLGGKAWYSRLQTAIRHSAKVMLLWILGVTFESLSAKFWTTKKYSSIVSLYIMLLGFRKSSTVIWFFPFLICQKFFIIRYEKHMKVLREMIDMMHCDIIIQKMIILESSFLEEGELLIHIFLLRLTTSSLMNFLFSFYTFPILILLLFTILFFLFLHAIFYALMHHFIS